MDYESIASVSSGVSLASSLFSLAIVVLTIIAMWKVFEKAGKPGWAAIIPFYNTYCLFDIAWGNGWLFLLTLIPCAGIVFYIIAYLKLARAFGKGTGFGIGLAFLSFIFLMILGFGDAEYLGPQN